MSVALVLEVLVERAGAEAGAARDLAQREVGRAALEQDLASGGQDVVACLRLPPFVTPAAPVGALGAVVREQWSRCTSNPLMSAV